MRPWIWMPRLFELANCFLSLVFFSLFQSFRSINGDDFHKRFAKEILNSITQLGPCFIKIGQALSTRPDLVRRDWLDELTNLQDNLPPYDHSSAVNIIKKELGSTPSDLFEDFPSKPIAAASLGQVYKARLHADYWVAVKVQRPNLRFILRRDLVILRFLSIAISPFLPLNLGFKIEEIVDEFGRSLFEEIDYELEADNAEKFSKLFADNQSITVPTVERLLSSKRVITTSWICGTKLKDKNELRHNGINPDEIIRTGVVSGLQQLLEFGYFHADPHPGNMFALKSKKPGIGHIAYIDFGMMDEISDLDRITLTSALVHLFNNDFDELARDFQSLGFLNKEMDLRTIIPALNEVLGASFNESVSEFNFKAITDRFSQLMYEYPFRVPARFALVIRAVVSQEGLALRLNPDFKIIPVAYPYVAARLLSGETQELLNILLDVVFDSEGNLRIERIKSLLDVLKTDYDYRGKRTLPVAGLRLLFGRDGSLFRSKLLMYLVKRDKTNLSDFVSIIKSLRSNFNPSIVAESLF